MTTDFVLTNMKIHLQPMNVKGRYCLSFYDFEMLIHMQMVFLNIP